MIVFENRIQELIGLIPDLDGFKPVFYWAKNGKEVNQFLSIHNQPYPFIYLNTGKENGKSPFKEVERDCVFVLACREKNTEMLNTQRLRNSYDKVLNPLAESLIDILDSSSISRIVGDYELTRIPNYTEAAQHAQIDYWDVIELRCKVILNNNCLKK